MSCDCCGKEGVISRVTAYGIETYVCHRCQGMTDEDAGYEKEVFIEKFRELAKTTKCSGGELVMTPELKDKIEEAMEAAEWEALGDTDLISTEELAEVVKEIPDEKEGI